MIAKSTCCYWVIRWCRRYFWSRRCLSSCAARSVTLQHAAEISGLTHVQVGDFKAISESRNQDTSDILDMTVMSKDRQECRVLGKCKADWTSQMLREYEARGAGGRSPEFRKWISKCFIHTSRPFSAYFFQYR